MAITLYRPEVVDVTDPTINGGAVSADIIEDGVLNNLFPNIRARAVEAGDERWGKFFLKSDLDITTVGICIGISNFSDGDFVYLANGGDTETEAELDKANIRLYGAFSVTNYDAINKKITADRDVSEFVKPNDIVTFYDSDNNRVIAYDVQNVSGNEVILKEVKDGVDLYGYSGHSTIYFESLTAGATFGFWVKEVVKPYKLPNDVNVLFNCLVWYE